MKFLKIGVRNPKWTQYSSRFNPSYGKTEINGIRNYHHCKLNNRRFFFLSIKYHNIKDIKIVQGWTNVVEENQGCSNQGCTDKGGTHKFKWCSRQLNNKHSNEKQRKWTFKVF